MYVSLDKITIDCGTQFREKIDQDAVDNYAEAMLDGAVFLPITLFNDGEKLYLADGYHRYYAAKKINAPGIDATIVNGTIRNAVLFATGANGEHGLHRTGETKRRQVITLVEDFEWSEWSDREIAKWCKVSHTFVAAIRKELGIKKTQIKYEREGKVLTKKVAEKKVDDKEDDDDSHMATLPDEEKEQLFEAVDILKAENEALTDKLAVISSSPEAAEREMAESLIAELRSKIRGLEAELNIVKQSRDTYQSEKAQLMKQNASLQRKLKQYEEKK